MENILKFNRKIILGLFLLICIALSVSSVVKATAPDPGHNFTESSGGITQGDLIFGSGTDAVSALTKNVTASRYLSNGGTSNNPAWAQINLTNGVTGALPVANGGTGAAPSVDDQVLVSDSTIAATWKTVNDCLGSENALTYTQVSNTWGCNTISAETVTTMGTLVTGADPKNTPIDADMVWLMDSTDSLLKKLSWANIKATLGSYFLKLDNSAAATVLIKDNNGAAISFAEGANSYLGFDTRDGIENIYSVKPHVFNGGATFSTAISARLTPRVGTTASSGTPTINTDDYEAYSITALAENITSMTTNLQGSPTNFQKLTIRIKDNGTPRTIAWGASFASKGATLPITTVTSVEKTVEFLYDSDAGTWGCIRVSDSTNALLDGYIHSDTTAGTVARGDVITGQGATPTWTRLAKGTAGQALMMDSAATDVAWGTPLGYTLFFQLTSVSFLDGNIYYFGSTPLGLTTTSAIRRVYVRKAGTIKAANLLCQSSSAIPGSNENWTMSIRLNNTSDTAIATVGAATSERVWSNTGLSLAVAAGDYLEIKSGNVTWASNPATTICGGYVYIEAY